MITFYWTIIREASWRTLGFAYVLTDSTEKGKRRGLKTRLQELIAAQRRSRHIMTQNPLPPIRTPPVGGSSGITVRPFYFFCYMDRPESKVCGPIRSVQARNINEAKAQANQACQRAKWFGAG